jgi:hypothetical protein
MKRWGSQGGGDTDEPGLANHVECLISDGTGSLTNLTAAFVGAGAAVHCAIPRSGATDADSNHQSVEDATSQKSDFTYADGRVQAGPLD